MEYQPHLPLVGEVERRRTTADDDTDWRLDEPTRRAGRHGVIAARAALAAAAAPATRTRADAA